MTVKISIIGLGQIGASIGLALANHKDQVSTLGYDSSAEVTRKAQKMGAVENTSHNLHAAVKGADVVVLSVPMDQVHETLKSMAKEVREQGLVIDMAPVKQAVTDWVKELLPPGCHFIGLTPVLNPLVLDETATGIDAARADLFQRGTMAITAPLGTAKEAYDLATGFVSLLGARTYFADLAEVDGIMAAVHIFPALAAAAFAETIIEQPGWADIRKLAGRPFVSAMRPLDLEESAALVESAQLNRVNVMRILNDYIAKLESWREEIDGEKKKSLKERLDRINRGRSQWRKARADGDWQAIETLEQEIPTFSELWVQQLGLGKLLGLGKKKED